MLCTACNKESKNLRVCPYCFTPYPTEPAPTKRNSLRMNTGSTPAVQPSAVREAYRNARALVMRQTPLVRWSGLGILVVLILWFATNSSPKFEAGVPQAAIIATPLQRDEALALIRTTRETALVDVQQDEVFVSYPAATFPVREEGQLALVQQFAEADGIVEARKRRIFFYNPNGKLFAQSDANRGVILVR